MKPLLATALASALALLPAAAAAQDAAPANTMGQPGQIAIHGDFQLSFVYQTGSAPDGAEDPDSVTNITLAPAADFFVTRGLSVGGQLVFAHTSQGDNFSADGYGAAPRIGYFAGLGPKVGVWPIVSVGYIHTSVDAGDLGEASGYEVILQAFAPLLFQPVDHFFLGIGPVFQTDLVSKVEDEDATKTTAFGLQTIVGGYW
ncbi:MAG TPA: hypothetical protein VFU21_27455 [Kofleriaceae bacterium]|nr:hypothetical protein [Kofleriaceae bacterium]